MAIRLGLGLNRNGITAVGRGHAARDKTTVLRLVLRLDSDGHGKSLSLPELWPNQICGDFREAQPRGRSLCFFLCFLCCYLCPFLYRRQESIPGTHYMTKPSNDPTLYLVDIRRIVRLRKWK